MKNENKQDRHQQSETERNTGVRNISNEDKERDLSKINSKEDYNNEDAGGTSLGHKKDQSRRGDQELNKQ